MSSVASDTKDCPAEPQHGPSFLWRNRFQIAIIGMLVVLYAVFLIGDWRTYTSFDIYRSFMISIPFFGIMALAAT
jgi:hypothetical protein